MIDSTISFHFKVQPMTLLAYVTVQSVIYTCARGGRDVFAVIDAECLYGSRLSLPPRCVVSREQRVGCL
jgi:hypothetical protein